MQNKYEQTALQRTSTKHPIAERPQVPLLPKLHGVAPRMLDVALAGCFCPSLLGAVEGFDRLQLQQTPKRCLPRFCGEQDAHDMNIKTTATTSNACVYHVLQQFIERGS